MEENCPVSGGSLNVYQQVRVVATQWLVPGISRGSVQRRHARRIARKVNSTFNTGMPGGTFLHTSLTLRKIRFFFLLNKAFFHKQNVTRKVSKMEREQFSWVDLYWWHQGIEKTSIMLMKWRGKDYHKASIRPEKMAWMSFRWTWLVSGLSSLITAELEEG